jgi:hypothetical protein
MCNKEVPYYCDDLKNLYSFAIVTFSYVENHVSSCSFCTGYIFLLFYIVNPSGMFQLSFKSETKLLQKR